MKKNIKKIIVILLIVILILVTGILFVLNNKNTNKDKVEVVSSLIEQQKNKEKNFKIDGYTIDNPNVILNPYGNSPLTAWILFETEKEVEIKILGAIDENFAVHNVFEKTDQMVLENVNPSDLNKKVIAKKEV